MPARHNNWETTPSQVRTSRSTLWTCLLKEASAQHTENNERAADTVKRSVGGFCSAAEKKIVKSQLVKKVILVNEIFEGYKDK